MRPKRRTATTAALAAMLVVGGACSSPQGTERPENSLLGKDKQEGKRDGAGGRKGSKKDGKPGRRGKTKTGAAAAPVPGTTIAPPAPAQTAAANSGAAKTETKVTSTGTDPRNASVLVTEPDPDAEKSGLVPEYAEVLSVRIQGLGEQFRVTMTFRAPLPEAMPDDKTYMIAGMGLTETRKDEGFAFGASAGTSGWTPYAGQKGEGGKFPGTFSIAGRTVVFTMPWSAIGGPRSFDWYSQASWFKSLANTTHYSLDILPNDGPAEYPAG